MMNNFKKILFGFFFIGITIFILTYKSILFELLAANEINVENIKLSSEQTLCGAYEKNNLNCSFTLKEDVRWILSIMNNPYFVFGLFLTGLVSSITVVFVFNLFDSFYQLITTGDGIVLCIGWIIQSGAMIHMLLRYFGIWSYF